MIIFLLAIALVMLGTISRQLVNIKRKIHMDNTELAAQLSALTAQLLKALNEITALQVGQQVPQEVVDKLAAAQALAQQLDDLNPDA